MCLHCSDSEFHALVSCTDPKNAALKEQLARAARKSTSGIQTDAALTSGDVLKVVIRRLSFTLADEWGVGDFHPTY